VIGAPYSGFPDENWLDIRQLGGTIVDGPAPASSFYHVVGAIEALNDAVAAL